MTDEWMDELRDFARGVRPVGDAVTPVADAVRRRRLRTRSVLAVGTAAVLVAGVTVGVSAATGPTAERDAPPPAATSTPEPTPDPTTDPTADPTVASDGCPLESRVFGAPPGQDHLDQLAQVATVHALMMREPVVRYAEATALGVVALVRDDTGDRDLWADPAVADRLRSEGATYVYEWDPSIAGSGTDAAGQVQQVLNWEITPALRDVKRSVRGIDGFGEIAYWNAAGAVLLSWKRPVPPEVAALEGTRADGVHVIVDPVAYSQRDVQQAQVRLQDWLVGTGNRDRWASSYACGDGSGLVVGMVPPLRDVAALEADISEAVGMPVTVVPEELPVPLVGTIEDGGDLPVG